MPKSALPRSLDRALLMLGGALAALGVVELVLSLPGSGPMWWTLVLVTLVYSVYAVSGLLAWHRRPANNMGMILVLGALAVFAGSLGNTGVPGLVEVGTVSATVVLAVAVHLLLAFPSGRVHGAAAAVVAAGYGVSILLQAPLYLFDPAVPTLTIADRPDLLAAGVWGQRTAGVVVVVAAAIILMRRLARAEPAQRRVLAPLFIYGMVTLLAVPVRGVVMDPLFGATAAAVIQYLLMAGVPIAFLLAMLRGGFARTGRLEELAVWLGRDETAREDLPRMLGRALGDGSIELLLWMPDRVGWVDTWGSPAEIPARAGRASVDVELAGERIGAIVYDGDLIDDPESVREAGRVIALALERERLLAQLMAQRGELLSSRGRIVAAADRERRRIARDLHDGIQVRLVLLAMDAQQIAGTESLEGARMQAVAVREGIDDAATELRTFVHRLMPAALIERGLCAATEDLVDRMPLPTTLHADLADGDLPAGVESAAYFLIAEGLANALKHASAQGVSVRIDGDGARLSVEVHDDGVGGAALHAGRGLRGLSDRIDALGGVLRIDSDSTYGTHLRAELPCVR